MTRSKSLQEREVLRIIQTDFDVLENHIAYAIHEECLGSFMNDEKGTAHKKADEFLNKLKITPYLSWNQRVYPQIRVEREFVQ